MFTAKQACEYLKISQDDLNRHLALSAEKGHRFTNSHGEQIFHDGDIERISMRMSYAKELAKEKEALTSQHGVATIDL